MHENVFDKLLPHFEERVPRDDETALEVASYESLTDEGESLEKDKSAQLADHHLTELNMHNRRMSRGDMKMLEQFMYLRKIVLSFNNLASIDELSDLVCVVIPRTVRNATN